MVYICISSLPHAICCGLVTCCIYQDDRDQNVKSGWVALSLSHRCRHCYHQLQHHHHHHNQRHQQQLYE